MQRKQILLVVLLLALIAVGMFVYAYIARQKIEAPQVPQSAREDTQAGVPEITRIAAKHYFTEPQGIHTLAGELTMPTPCDLISTNAVLLDNGARALISFDVVNNSAQACEAKATTQRFKVGFQAPKGIKIEATYKGNPIPLDITEAGAAEKPADFQLFDKG